MPAGLLGGHRGNHEGVAHRDVRHEIQWLEDDVGSAISIRCLQLSAVLGALTSDDKLQGRDIGKIDIFDKLSFVAVNRPLAKPALKILSEGKIKGRKFRVRKLR